MIVPHEQNLQNQTYRSDKMEFVWVFQKKDGIHQLVFGILKTGKCYLESGMIDCVSNYIGNPFFIDNVPVNHLTKDGVWGKFEDYNNFHSGQDLVSLANECLVYLNSP